MKRLIVVGGTMGVGKTAVCEALLKKLPQAVFLDGDWCWRMDPFVVNTETKAMVLDHITHLLRGFLQCSVYENVIFCWVLHREDIVRQVLDGLRGLPFALYRQTLVCSPEALRDRLQRDVEAGRRAPDVIARSLERLPLYRNAGGNRLDVGSISADQAADRICAQLCETPYRGDEER